MTRSSSIEAYNYIKETGALGRKREQVYGVLFLHGPLTSGEAYQYLNRTQSDGALTQSRARFTELRDMGFIKEVGKRACSVTGRVVIEWDVTDNTAAQTKPKPIKTKCPHCSGRGYTLGFL